MLAEDLNTGDYPEYYKKYINLLPNNELLFLLQSQRERMVSFLSGLTEDELKISYAEGKWTCEQVIQHMIDTERIFQYRALRIGRGDKTPLHGYDQDDYVLKAGFLNKRSSDFIEEYSAVREAGITLFKGLSNEALYRTGISNNYPLSAGSAGFIIAGHELHHLNLFKSHYNL